jgi:hypothetical protein
MKVCQRVRCARVSPDAMQTFVGWLLWSSLCFRLSVLMALTVANHFVAYGDCHLESRIQDGIAATGSLHSLVRNVLTRLHTTPRPESDRPSDRRLSAKLLPTFTDRGCHVVNVTDPYGSILCFLDRSRYFSFQVAPRLYSRG